jgi:hypothetical protein
LDIIRVCVMNISLAQDDDRIMELPYNALILLLSFKIDNSMPIADLVYFEQLTIKNLLNFRLLKDTIFVLTSMAVKFQPILSWDHSSI